MTGHTDSCTDSCTDSHTNSRADICTNTHEIFNQASDKYRSARPLYPDELFDVLAQWAPSRELAWDCATGNGQAAVALASYFEAVVASDVAANQIANAIAHERVSYRVGPAETTEFADASVDLITVAQALHWFEYDKFWPEVQRILKPGGIFAAWGYDVIKINPVIDELLSVHVHAPINDFWHVRNRLLWDGYRNVGFPLQALTMPALDMRLQWTLPQLIDYLGTWSATRQCVEQRGDAFLRHAHDIIAQVWAQDGKADAEGAREIRMPLHLLVGRKD